MQVCHERCDQNSIFAEKYYVIVVSIDPMNIACFANFRTINVLVSLACLTPNIP